jgi:glutamyl-tRNA synthetase
MLKVRTRVAPSPTGDPHVGTAYMALFNYCFAQKNNGEFILRIEDTDTNRSTIESENKIFESLKWLGLKWSEGPDIGGKFGPYRQSERKDIYLKHAEELLSKGHAFRCFCSSHEIEDMKKNLNNQSSISSYTGKCLSLTEEEIQQKISKNQPYVIRMKIPNNGVCIINDYFRGEIKIPWEQMDMQVLLKQDKMPTYFLANVVDDYLMEITHVIRGEEWLPSTPKTLLLYQYFGWNPPVFCHMPLLRDIDGGKLSKRKNPTSITFYKDKGYLPEALINYLGRMAYSRPDQKEKFSLSDMISDFNLKRISLGGPVFDVQKLSWLNGLWIREKNQNDFKNDLINWFLENEKIDKIIPLIQSRIETFDQVADLSSFIFNSDLNYDLNLFLNLDLTKEQVISILKTILKNLESNKEWNKDEILKSIKTSSVELDIKFKHIMPLVFLTITGKLSSFSVIDSMEIIGADLSRYRFRRIISLLK